MLNIIANIMAVSALIPLGSFIYFYGTRPAPGKWYRRKYSNLWRTTEIGRILMYQKISWFSFLLFVLVGIFTEPYPGEATVRLIIYAALLTLFWRVFISLRKIQKNGPVAAENISLRALWNLRKARAAAVPIEVESTTSNDDSASTEIKEEEPHRTL